MVETTSHWSLFYPTACSTLKVGLLELYVHLRGVYYLIVLHVMSAYNYVLKCLDGNGQPPWTRAKLWVSNQCCNHLPSHSVDHHLDSIFHFEALSQLFRLSPLFVARTSFFTCDTAAGLKERQSSEIEIVFFIMFSCTWSRWKKVTGANVTYCIGSIPIFCLSVLHYVFICLQDSFFFIQAIELLDGADSSSLSHLMRGGTAICSKRLGS